MATDEGDVTIPANQFTELLEAVKKSSEQFQELKGEIAKTRDETTEAVAKRLKKERQLNFKSKGNRIQHETNEEVMDKLEAAVSSVEKAIANPEKAAASLGKTVEVLNEGKTLLAARQKHIRIADRSEHGWNTVVEYEADELASDSDDEKKLEKAEKAADRKAQRGRKRKQDFQSWKAKRPSSGAPSSYTYGQLSTGGSSGSGAYFNPATAGQRGGASASASATGVPKPIGPCFHCLQMGHLRRNCPRLSGSSTVGKWYPFRQGSDACVGAEWSGKEGDNIEGASVSDGEREGEGDSKSVWCEEPHDVEGEFPGCLDVRAACLLGQHWGGFSVQQEALEEGCLNVIPPWDQSR